MTENIVCIPLYIVLAGEIVLISVGIGMVLGAIIRAMFRR